MGKASLRVCFLQVEQRPPRFSAAASGLVFACVFRDSVANRAHAGVGHAPVGCHGAAGVLNNHAATGV
jgi:hypothetical protein